MGRDVKFILLSRDEASATELRAALINVQGIKLVAEVDEPALLGQAVKQFSADIVLVDLDPQPENLLPILGDVVTSNPAVSVFATSQSTDGRLILKVIRIGIKEFLPKPIDPAALAEALEKVFRDRCEVGTEGKLITVIGAAGGVGATTITTNLGVELAALRPGAVTVVDLDYRYGQLATLLDVEPPYTLADLCGSHEQIEPQVITRALVEHGTGLRVLCRPQNFAEADTITAAACVGVLSTLVKMNDYVVADGPTRFDPAARSIVALADLNLIVVQLLVPSVRNASRILETMRQAGYSLDRTKIICNRVGRDAGHLTVENVRETLGIEVFATIPDDWLTVSGSINLGEPLRVQSPKSKVRAAIEDIATRIHSPSTGGEEKESKRKGLIGRIFQPTS